MICPDYRLRLFLSVDLVGSTAFKAKFGDPDPEKSPNPVWVDQIRHFYREFPEILSRNFAKAVSASTSGQATGLAPAVWKTIGDEIIFCCRLVDQEHLAACITSFMRTLSDYGGHLDQTNRPLDVKAYGWVAAFPSPNVTVEVYGRASASSPSPELPDEETEASADRTPREYDFLGKGIDAGFRSGRFCSADSLMLSLELAYLTAIAARERLLPQLEFEYSGRESLKGVINDRPYPLISVDAERNSSRRQVRERERTVSGQSRRPTPLQLIDFINAFMDDENIEKPLLQARDAVGPNPDYPRTYLDFERNWRAVSKELESRRASEAISIEKDDGSVPDIPPELTAALDVAEKIASQQSEKSNR